MKENKPYPQIEEEDNSVLQARDAVNVAYAQFQPICDYLVDEFGERVADEFESEFNEVCSWTKINVMKKTAFVAVFFITFYSF